VSKQASIGVAVRLALSLCAAVALCAGCGRDEVKPATTTTWTPKEADWTPQPIEFPKPPDNVWRDPGEAAAVDRGQWPGVASKVALIRFSPDGSTALITSADGQCHAVDSRSGQVQWEARDKTPAVAIEITLDNKRVVTQHQDDPHLHVRQLADGKVVQTLDHSKAVSCALAVAADPRLLATGAEDGTLRIWSLDTGKVLSEGKISNSARPTAIAFANDCKELYVADRSGEIGVYDLPDLVRGGNLEHCSAVALQLVPDTTGDTLAVVGENAVAEIIPLKPSEGNQSPTRSSLGGTPLRHGTHRNWHCLSVPNCVCCYLGKGAFEYRGLPSGGLAGSQSVADEPIAEVAVSRDGKVAATGFADGSVRFYDLPGPAMPCVVQHRERGARLYRLLSAEQFDELDALAEATMDETRPDASHGSLCETLEGWLAAPQRDKESLKTQVERLNKWLEAKPDSRAARFALAHALTEYAWSLRGIDVAARTSGEAFRGFHEQLTKADELLQQIDDDHSTAQVYRQRVIVAMGLSRSSREIVDLWKRGSEREPLYARLHSSAVYALLPRWHGFPGDAARLADHARSELPGDAGPIAYGVMASLFMETESPVGLLGAGFDVEKLEEAAQARLKTFPESIPAKNFAAIVACLRHDRPAAAQRFFDMAGRRQIPMWKHEHVLKEFQTWANRAAGDSRSETVILGAWFFPRALAYTNEENELITLGMDFRAPIQVWDTANSRVDRVLPVPEFCPPWKLSPGGKYVACVRLRTPQPQVVVFERGEDDLRTVEGANQHSVACFSDSERLMAVCNNDKRIAVYDLGSQEGEPVAIALEREAIPLAIADSEQDWTVVACEADGRLRHLSRDAKDLIGEVKLPRRAERGAILAKSHRVLVQGESLLAMVDLMTGAVCELGSNQGADDGTYTALAVSRDGSMAAAARQRRKSDSLKSPYWVELWDLNKGTQIDSFSGNDDAVISLSFSASNQHLASGDKLGFVHIFSLKDTGSAP
jgi:WD40 repeat protein